MAKGMGVSSGLRRCALVGAISAIALVPAVLLGQEVPEVAEGRVEAQLDQETDRQVEDRLKATFATLEELSDVVVSVEAGVVLLEGSVDSSSARALAGELARQVEGVTAVENAIEETKSVERRLGVAFERFEERLWSLIDGLPIFLLALVVVAVSMLLARWLVSWELPFRWLTNNVFLRELARQAVRVALVMGGALVALDLLDATALVGAVLGAAGVAGLAVGFAFRDLVENYIASILLSLRQPFSPNDLVRIEGHEGHVARLTSRATTLVTHDGNHVRIPNGVVFKSVIENLTRRPERRFSFGVGVGVEEDLAAAQDLGTRILNEMPGVLDSPEPFCRVEELGDSSVSIRFYGWVDQREADFGKVRSEAIRVVKQAFDERGIDMPEPIHRLRIEQAGAAGRSEGPKTPQSQAVRDVSVDAHVNELVDEERASGGPDLLSEAGEAE